MMLCYNVRRFLSIFSLYPAEHFILFLPVSWTSCPSYPESGWFLRWAWGCVKFLDPAISAREQVTFGSRRVRVKLRCALTGRWDRSWKECGERTATAKKRRNTKLLTAEYWTCGSPEDMHQQTVFIKGKTYTASQHSVTFEALAPSPGRLQIAFCWDGGLTSN